MQTPQYEVIRRDDGRYVITNAATQEVIDNAQGYGYKTRQNAENAAWYKFKGGKATQDAAKQEAIVFWRGRKDFAQAVQDYFETCFKEIAGGETDPDADRASLAKEMGVDGFKKSFVDSLP